MFCLCSLLCSSVLSWLAVAVAPGCPLLAMQSPEDAVADTYDEAPSKTLKRKVSWSLLNPNFRKYESEVSASRVFFSVVRLPLCGFWFRPGAGQALVKVSGDVVGDRVSGAVSFNSGTSHGNATIYTHQNGKVAASMDFHHLAQETNLKQHYLEEVLPGLFRSKDHRTAWICPERFCLYDRNQFQGCKTSMKLLMPESCLPLSIPFVEAEFGRKILKSLAWVHSGRGLQFLFILDSWEVLWCSEDGSCLTPAPTGEVSYCYINEGVDMFHVRFHYGGQEEHASSMLLVRASSTSLPECNIWRTSGPEYKTMLSLAKSRGCLLHCKDPAHDPSGNNLVVMIELCVVT